MSFTLHGQGVSNGIAIGRALRVSSAVLEVAHREISSKQVEKEILRLDTALRVVREDLLNLKNTAGNVPSELFAFIDLHITFLNDPELTETPKSIIREKRCNAEWALSQQMEYLFAQFEQFEDPYLRERKYDVAQVVERVLKEMAGHPPRKPRNIGEEQQIIVAHDLSPADVIAYKGHHFAAFVTDVGGATSHTAILARSMAVPAIVGITQARSLVRDGEWLIVDGIRGVLIASPDERVLDEYRIRKEQIELERAKLKYLRNSPSETLDGETVTLLANIEMPEDAKEALASGADGIGLYRTEFLFLGRNDIPSEDEQFEAYRKVVKTMESRPVTIRTFDLGGDKALDMQRRPTNPALGRRAIRLSLVEPGMFQTQLRAILRASRYGKVRLLIPMFSHAYQIDAALSAVEEAKASLRAGKIPFDEEIKVGGMIEVPCAALAINMFLKRLDFLSIGTNDLIQYTLAIDRTDEQVANLYDPLHPAVLMLVAHAITTAVKAGIPISVCGEMAGAPKFTWLFLGFGLRVFSMHPSQILSVKSRILQADTNALAPATRRILRLDETPKTIEAVDKLNMMQREAE